MLLKSKYIVALFVLIHFITACSGSSSGNGDGNKPGGGTGGNNKLETELGYDSKQRWPETGDFSYSLNFTENGSEVCKENKRFDTKSEYCLTLQDQQKNQSCSLSYRKSTYLGNCGSDFQEINITQVFVKIGYDTYLNKQCRTGQLNQGEVLFTTKNYCDFLKDETRHSSCFWKDRFLVFDSLNCQGNFSQKPTAGNSPTPPSPPNSNPSPNPGPSPSPTDPIENIAVVKYLRSQGISVDVSWDAIHDQPPLPGEISNAKKLELFWAMLDQNRQELVNRKKNISGIKISTYTTYHSYPEINKKILYLDFVTKQNDLTLYFPLFDKLLDLTLPLDLKVSMIHSTYGDDTYRPLKNAMSALEKNFDSLTKMKGIIKEITSESYSSYSAYRKTLSVNSTDFNNEFDRYIQLLLPLSDFYGWVLNKKINFVTNYDIDNNTQQVYSAFALLKANKQNLEYFILNNDLQKLEFTIEGYSTINFDKSSKQLSIRYFENDNPKLNAALGSLGKISKISIDLKVPIDFAYIDILNDLTPAVNIVESLTSKIKTKISKIKNIMLEADSHYYDSNQTLVIGYKTPIAETEKIINLIH